MSKKIDKYLEAISAAGITPYESPHPNKKPLKDLPEEEGKKMKERVSEV